MNLNGIKMHLNKVVNDFIENASDLFINYRISRSDFKNHILISGGSIPSLMLGKRVNDYDLYICGPNKNEIISALFNYYRNMYTGLMKSSVNEMFGLNDSKYLPKVITKNSITLSNKIQIITRFNGDTPEDIISNFDFLHVTGYYRFNSDIKTSVNIMDSIINKRLIYVGSKFPLSSIIRSKKFIHRGWKIDPIEYIKMVNQYTKIMIDEGEHIKHDGINDIKIKNEVIINQLTGMYSDLCSKIENNLTGHYTNLSSLNELIESLN